MIMNITLRHDDRIPTDDEFLPMKRNTQFLMLLTCLVLLISLPTAAQQNTTVTAEAIGRANLRASADITSILLGEITSGTRYPVIGRSEFYPWLLLGEVGTLRPIGWVFQDLLTIYGDLSTVPFSTLIVDPNAAPPAATLPAITTAPEASTSDITSTPPIAATATLANAITGTLSGTVNLRSGPGVEYPRIGEGRAGDVFVITAYHSGVPWVRVQYDAVPSGEAWIAVELLEIQGDIYTLPAISQLNFPTPTITPTPQPVQISSLFGQSEPILLSPAFEALGTELWMMMSAAGFELQTSRTGALFVMDLQTGEAMAFGSNVAFSGTSINKIAIMTELYRTIDLPPDDATAVTLANMIVCSENTATNRVMQIVGNGDPYRGGVAITNTLRQLGLQNTFILTPFQIAPGDPPPPTFPIERPTTRVDQGLPNLDPYNQLTVDEMGWLLASLYQCAYHESGPLITTFDGEFEGRECRQMLHAMSENKIGAMLEAGVPAGTRIAHKHGWVNETHGDAGIVFTPGGDFVLVAMLHDSTGADPWLDYTLSFPLVAEITRTVYNYFNPDAPLEAIRNESVPAQCTPPGQLILDLTAQYYDE